VRHEQTVIYERCIALTARCFDAAPEPLVERGKALALELVKMLSKFHRT
jgi:hypothetical protein